MFSSLRDREDIKEPWDPKCVYSVCVGVIIFVSALLVAWRKLTAGCCGVLKLLCVLCARAYFLLFISFVSVCRLGRERCSASDTLWYSPYVLACLCSPSKRVSLSCVPVILCMLRPAPQCFTWHQSERSGIVISLPTACCWLKPVVCTHPLSFLLAPLPRRSPLLPCPFASPHPTLLPPFNSRVAPFCGFSTACCQKGPHFKLCKKL